MQGCIEPIPYPPRSLSAGVPSLCSQGNTDPVACNAKLAVLLYACLDMGVPVDLLAFRLVPSGSAADAFALSPCNSTAQPL